MLFDFLLAIEKLFVKLVSLAKLRLKLFQLTIMQQRFFIYRFDTLVQRRFHRLKAGKPALCVRKAVHRVDYALFLGVKHRFRFLCRGRKRRALNGKLLYCFLKLRIFVALTFYFVLKLVQVFRVFA